MQKEQHQESVCVCVCVCVCARTCASQIRPTQDRYSTVSKTLPLGHTLNKDSLTLMERKWGGVGELKKKLYYLEKS